MMAEMLTPSYIAVSAQVTERTVLKYAGLSASHLFVPIAIETLSPENKAGHFLVETGQMSFNNLR